MFNKYHFMMNSSYVDSVIAQWEMIRNGSADTDYLGIIFYLFGDGM